MKGIPTRGPRTLSWAQRGPHSQAMGPQLGTEGFPPTDKCLQTCTQWSPPVGWGLSTAQRGLQFWAIGPQLGMEGSQPMGLTPEKRTMGPCSWAWRPQSRQQLSSPATGRVPPTPRKESPVVGRTPSASHGGPPAGLSTAHVGPP